MKLLEEIVELYDYIKELEQENKDLKNQLEIVRQEYKKLNKEIIELELTQRK